MIHNLLLFDSEILWKLEQSTIHSLCVIITEILLKNHFEIPKELRPCGRDKADKAQHIIHPSFSSLLSI